jgi:hypothetical protein
MFEPELPAVAVLYTIRPVVGAGVIVVVSSVPVRATLVIRNPLFVLEISSAEVLFGVVVLTPTCALTTVKENNRQLIIRTIGFILVLDLII